MPTIRTILLELRKALTAVIGDEKRIVIVAQRPAVKMPNLVGERDILIRPRGFVIDQGVVESAGRSNTLVRRNIDLILRSRLSLDAVNADLKYLTEEGIGQLEFEDQVFDAVQMWMGDIEAHIDGDPALLVGDGIPARVVSGGDVARDFQATDSKWGASIITIEVMYRQALDQDVV